MELNSELSLEIVRRSTCCHCCSTFQLFDQRDNLRHKPPILLFCRHAACLTCVVKTAPLAILCRICDKKKTDCLSGKTMYHSHLFGHLSVVKSSPHQKKIVLKTQLPVGENDLCIECNDLAEFECKDCHGSKLCDPCWLKIHNAASYLRKHTKTVLKVSDDFKATKCDLPGHEGQYKQFFCTTCSEVLCCHCIISLHQGHNAESILQRNLALGDRLDKAIVTAEEFISNSDRTMKLLKIEKRPSKNAGPKDRIRTIVDFFARLHGELQMQEQKAIEALSALDERVPREIAELQRTVSANMQKASNLLEYAREFKEVPQQSPPLNLDALVERMEALAHQPCHLLMKADVPDHSELQLNENVFATLNDLVTLPVIEEKTFSIVSADDAPEEFLKSHLEESLSKLDLAPSISSLASLPSFQSVSELNHHDIPSPLQGNQDDGSSTRSFGSQTPPVSFKKSATKARRPNPAQQSTFACEDIRIKDTAKARKRDIPPFFQSTSKDYFVGADTPVTVCIFNDPSDFYVITRSDLSHRNDIERNIQRNECYFQNIANIKEDQFVLAQLRDRKWVRALTTTVEKNSVHVLFYDYGMTKVVPKSELATVPPAIGHSIWATPALAIKCKIFNLISINRHWSQQATEEVLKVLSRARMMARMIVFGMNYGVVEIDLRCNDSLGMEPRSIHNLLLLAQHAVIADGDAGNMPEFGPPVSAVVPHYPRRPLLKPNASFNVAVVNAVTPTHFYVQKVNDAPLFRDINRHLTALCDSEAAPLIPAPDMPCAVFNAEGNNWVRGKIVKFHKDYKVELIDLGRIIPLQPKEVYRLPPQFLRHPPMSWKAGLCDIRSKSNQWSIETCDMFRKFVDKKELKMTVITVDRSLMVVLVDEKKRISLGHHLIDTGAAIFGGVSSDGFFKDIKKHQQKAKPSNPQACLKSAITEEDVAVELRKTSLPSTRDIKEVIVLKSDGPSRIYFAEKSHSEELKKMGQELGSKFIGLLPANPAPEWKQGDRCAFFSNTYRHWRRGVVNKLKGDDAYTTCEVLGIDTLHVESVNVSVMHKLPKSLSNVVIVRKAHLAGVKAPNSHWTSVALDFVSSVFSEYDAIFMHTQGEVGDKESVPAEFFGRKASFGAVFSPMEVTYECINEALIKKGLAVPVPGYKFFNFSLGDNVEEALTPVEVTPRVSRPTSPEDTKSSNFPDGLPLVLPSVTADWLPHLPLGRSRVQGFADHVDERGVIYFDLPEDGIRREEIQRSLTNAFKDSQPEAMDKFYEVGQICSAKFYGDQHWYRAKILQTNVGINRTYVVLFVDYGSIEICQVTELRKHVCGLDVPILCHSCYVADLRPINGKKYVQDAIDYMHKAFVDQVLEINILPCANDDLEPVPARVTRLDVTVDIFEELVEKKQAFRVKNPKPYVLGERDLTGSEVVSFALETKAASQQTSPPPQEIAEAPTGTTEEVVVTSKSWIEMIEEQEGMEEENGETSLEEASELVEGEEEMKEIDSVEDALLVEDQDSSEETVDVPEPSEEGEGETHNEGMEQTEETYNEGMEQTLQMVSGSYIEEVEEHFDTSFVVSRPSRNTSGRGYGNNNGRSQTVVHSSRRRH